VSHSSGFGNSIQHFVGFKIVLQSFSDVASDHAGPVYSTLAEHGVLHETVSLNFYGNTIEITG
jgi:hypothetical protein